MKLVRYNQFEPAYPSTFGSLLDKFFNESLSQTTKQFIPAVDISEDEKQYEIQVSVPGMKKSDFHLDLTEGRLTISGERKMEEKKEGKNFHSIETHYGSFSRSFYVPETISVENISAVYEDGLLKVVLPKTEKKVNNLKIEVK
ncbi:Hsp20/alpha crystallin family protein [Cecembia calidifontis]|uniref:Heat shock protein Hsp20 n=1 Tax=Cecembia calidifontis TaxID=1187080 RepID=A0A4Q7PIC3_9BACT|nr:Hsp20/alpha crystallin family protein [Cecembia calidifontis]RZS98662.1 heat shock protein Hsp20 [Cecembia calidifontis]